MQASEITEKLAVAFGLNVESGDRLYDGHTKGTFMFLPSVEDIKKTLSEWFRGETEKEADKRRKQKK